MSPTLNGNTALQRFEHSNVVEIHNRMMFDFYLGLPHMYLDEMVHTCILLDEVELDTKKLDEVGINQVRILSENTE